MASAAVVPNVPTDGMFVKFVPFRKVEDAKKGAPTVWGIATFEKEDLDGEICHYDTAKPVYMEWSAAALKRTAKAGQKASLGNIRIQHGLDVGGKATKLDFNDDEREIWLGSEPINEAMHQQLKDGYYTGYSQGGSYAWRKCVTCDTDLGLKQRSNYCPTCKTHVAVLYGLASLAEVSYVDSPCTAEGFEHVKANGSVEVVKFKKKESSIMAKTKTVAGVALEAHCFAYVGDPEKTETWKLPIEFPGDDAKTKSHIRNALARFDQTQGIPETEKSKVKARIESAARQNGIEVSEKALVEYRTPPKCIVARVDKAAAESGFRKGLYHVGMFAEVLSMLGYICRDLMYERDMEGDDSQVPEEIADNLDSLIETFLVLAEEEARELAAQAAAVGNKSTTGDTTMTEQELQKTREEADKLAKRTMATHLTKTAHHHEKMEAGETLKAEHHTAMHEFHKSAHAGMSKADVVEAKEGPKGVHEVIADVQEFHKAAGEHHKAMAKTCMGCAKTHGAMATACHKMADECDTDEHKKAVEAFKAATAAAEAATDSPVVKTTATPTLETDVAAAAEELRNTPAYKDAIKSMAQTRLDAELDALRKTTLAPDGVRVAGATADVSKGVRVVGRDGQEEAFAFAGIAPSATTAGL
jgi:hypothetical protein